MMLNKRDLESAVDRKKLVGNLSNINFSFRSTKFNTLNVRYIAVEIINDHQFN